MKGKITSIGIVFLLFIGSFGAFANKSDNCNCIILNIKKEENSRNNNYALGLLVNHLKDDLDLPEPITLLGNSPSSWDWRNVDGKNWITPIRDQAYCGSCWAFGAVAALEAIYNIKNNNSNIDLDLSEQFLVSCSMSFPYNNQGCCGGYLSSTLNFMRLQGVILESCFSYVAVDANGRDAGDCPDKNPSNAPIKCLEKCSSWKSQIIRIGEYYVLNGKESIKNAVTSYGPVIAAFSVYEDFKEYTGGIYKQKTGDFIGGHIVAIIGYDDLESYWICKNSWGPNWGEEGFFKIAYGECQIDSPGNSAYFKSCKKSYIKIYPFFHVIFEKLPLLYLFFKNLFNLL